MKLLRVILLTVPTIIAYTLFMLFYWLMFGNESATKMAEKIQEGV